MTADTTTRQQKMRHRRLVETLGLSSYGDTDIIAYIEKRLEGYTHKQPYEHNILLQIKYLLDDYLNEVEQL